MFYIHCMEILGMCNYKTGGQQERGERGYTVSLVPLFNKPFKPHTCTDKVVRRLTNTWAVEAQLDTLVTVTTFGLRLASSQTLWTLIAKILMYWLPTALFHLHWFHCCVPVLLLRFFLFGTVLFGGLRVHSSVGYLFQLFWFGLG